MKLIAGLMLMLCGNIAIAQYYPTPGSRVYGEPAQAEDRHAIDAVVSRFVGAWSGQDALTVAETHAADAEWINAFGRTFRGNAALEAFLRNQLFPDYPPEVSVQEIASFRETSRRYTGKDAAVIQAAITSNRGSALRGDVRKIFFTLVLQKIQAEWLIVHQTITDVRPRRI